MDMKISERGENTILGVYPGIIAVYVFIAVLIRVLLFYVCIAVLTLDAGLLARSQYPEGPANGHLDTGFSWFPCCLQANAEMVPKFPSCYYMPLM